MAETTQGVHWAVRGDPHLPPQLDPENGNGLHPYAWTVADPAELEQTLIDYVVNGVIVIPEAMGCKVLSTGDIYTFDVATSSWVWSGGASGLMGGGTATHLAGFTAANTIGDVPVTFDDIGIQINKDALGATKPFNAHIVPTVIDSTLYQIVINGVTVSFTSGVGTTAILIMNGLADAISGDPVLGVDYSLSFYDNYDTGFMDLHWNTPPLLHPLVVSVGANLTLTTTPLAINGVTLLNGASLMLDGANGSAVYVNHRYSEDGGFQLGDFDGELLNFGFWDPTFPGFRSPAFVNPTLGVGSFDGGLFGGKNGTPYGGNIGSYNRFSGSSMFSGVKYWGWMVPTNIVSGSYNDYEPYDGNLCWSQLGPTPAYRGQPSVSRLRFTVSTDPDTHPGNVTGDCTLTGLLRPDTVGGNVVYVNNKTPYNFILKDRNGSSDKNNQFYFPNGDIVLHPGESIILMSDSSDGYLGWSAVDSWMLGAASALYLPLAGGTMTGDIDMGANKITGLGAATAAGDALPYGQDFVASGASHKPGGVPDPGASAGTTKFLREDATWATPPGSGGGATAVNKAFADSPYNASYGENVFVNAAGGNVIVNLPPATGSSGIVNVKKIDSSANTVTVVADTTGTPDLIDDEASKTIDAQYVSLSVQDAVANKLYII